MCITSVYCVYRTSALAAISCDADPSRRAPRKTPRSDHLLARRVRAKHQARARPLKKSCELRRTDGCPGGGGGGDTREPARGFRTRQVFRSCRLRLSLYCYRGVLVARTTCPANLSRIHEISRAETYIFRYGKYAFRSEGHHHPDRNFSSLLFYAIYITTTAVIHIA